MNINRIHISGFKSLLDVNMPMNKAKDEANVIIGPNGAGKTNVLLALRMLNQMHMSRLGPFVREHGGADKLISFDADEIKIRIEMKDGPNEYKYKATFSRAYSDKENLQVKEECFRYCMDIEEKVDNSVIKKFLRNCNIYEFNARGIKIGMKLWDASDHKILHPQGYNLSSVLGHLASEYKQTYKNINYQVSRLLPMFEEFHLHKKFNRSLTLKWKVKGNERFFDENNTSDAAARLMALVTLLHLPKEMLPKLLLLDEVDKGLHPVAVELLGYMVQGLSRKVQVIVTTHSPDFVDLFPLHNILVFNSYNGYTEYNEIHENPMGSMSTAELWQKNLIGGRP